MAKQTLTARLATVLFLCMAAGISVAQNISTQDKEVWVRAIKRVKMKPPCCGACKIITQEESKSIWEYLTSGDPEKKKGKYLEVWKEHREKLLDEFKQLSPERYSILYGSGTVDSIIKSGSPESKKTRGENEL